MKFIQHFWSFVQWFLSLCCSHASSHIPEAGVNVMVMTCFFWYPCGLGGANHFSHEPLPWHNPGAKRYFGMNELGCTWANKFEKKNLVFLVFSFFLMLGRWCLYFSFPLCGTDLFICCISLRWLWTLINAVTYIAYIEVRFFSSVPFKGFSNYR